MTAARTTLTGRAAVVLAAGVVVLEFAAASVAFVSATLVPVVVADLDARARLGLLLAGASVGLFVALPLAAPIARRIGTTAALTTGLLGYVAGSVTTALAVDAWMFAAGQFVAGAAGGLVAVFGISAVIDHLDGTLRGRVVAAASAMWILPAMVGPPATVALEHVVGWRWTILVPLPLVVAGRVLVARVVRRRPPAAVADARLDGARTARTMLIPAGAVLLIVPTWWPVAVLGLGLATVGLLAAMPAGTLRLRAGAPTALAAMMLFAIGYFGADSLVTVLLTDAYDASLGRAALVLTAAPLAWALTSLAVARWRTPGLGAWVTAGLAIAAVGVAVVGVAAVTPLGSTAAFVAGLVAWTLTGVGIGLAYPGLYVACTDVAAAPAIGSVALATAVLTAESFGNLVGRSAGSAVTTLVGAATTPTAGLVTAYVVLAAALAAGAVVAARGVATWPAERAEPTADAAVAAR